MRIAALCFSALACAGALCLTSAPASAAQISAECLVIDVATYADRVHIHCGPMLNNHPPQGPLGISVPTYDPFPGPPYLAVEINSPMAASVVQLGTAALLNNRIAYITYESDTSRNPAGCQVKDCARLVGIYLKR